MRVTDYCCYYCCLMTNMEWIWRSGDGPFLLHIDGCGFKFVAVLDVKFCSSTCSTDSSYISESAVPELYALMFMPTGDVLAQRGAIRLLIWALAREGRRLDGVGIHHDVVSTNGNKMGVMLMRGLCGIVVGSADVGFWILRAEAKKQVG